MIVTVHSYSWETRVWRETELPDTQVSEYVRQRSDETHIVNYDAHYDGDTDDESRPVYTAVQAVTPHRYRGRSKWCTMCLLPRVHERHAIQVESLEDLL